MRLTIHRGSNEIGGSCVEVQSGNSRVVLDLGMPLVEPDGARFDMRKVSRLSGPELVQLGILPDIPGLYHWDNSKVDGLLISHSHMDHCGLSQYINPEIPVYTGEATKHLLELNKIFTPFEGLGGNTGVFQNGRPFQLGRFRITPFLVDHSAFDAYAFLVEVDNKRLFYTGDFRDHGRKPWTLPNIKKALAGIRIDGMLLEGTMFGRPGKKNRTEQDIEEELVGSLKQSQAPAFLCASAQNIDRLVSFYKTAIRCNRLLAVDVYTANVLDVVKDYAKIPFPSYQYKYLKVFFPYLLCQKLVQKGQANRFYRYRHYKITPFQMNSQLNKLMVLIRPSLIDYMKKISIPSSSHFIYSMWKGYQDDEGMASLMGFARQKQMEIREIHTGGHASLGALKELVEMLKPKVVIPIHTFHPEKYDYFGVPVRPQQDGVANYL